MVKLPARPDSSCLFVQVDPAIRGEETKKHQLNARESWCRENIVNSEMERSTVMKYLGNGKLFFTLP